MASRLAHPDKTSRRLEVANVFIRINGEVGFVTRDLAKKMLRDIAKTLDYRVLGHLDHGFKPYGVTTVLLLSESHLSIHTWPEHRRAIVEMVTCKPFVQSDRQRLLAVLKRHLPAATFRVILNV